MAMSSGIAAIFDAEMQANKNIASGYCPLDANILVPDANLPLLNIVNADVNASAAIAKTKLANLDLVNADVNASAAIDGTKLSLGWQKNVPDGIAGLDDAGYAPHIIAKIISANVRNSHDAEIYTGWNLYLKLKTFTISYHLKGTVRILFDLRSSEATQQACGRIYVNGVAVGTEQTNDTITYVTKSEDFSINLSAGDTCELWAKAAISKYVYVKNFRLAYDDNPTVAVGITNS